MEIAFPIEFLVHGTPVSLQARRADSREKWKARVRQASRSAIPEAYFASRGRMAVTLFYLPDGRMQGDIDNIVKPVIDALARHIYIDDRQVERIVVQKFEPDRVFSFVEPTEILARALSGRRPVLYIRVSDDPTAELS